MKTNRGERMNKDTIRAALGLTRETALAVWEIVGENLRSFEAGLFPTLPRVEDLEAANARLRRALDELRIEANAAHREVQRLGKLGEEVQRAEARADAAVTAFRNLQGALAASERDLAMYANAWAREIGAPYANKRHHIDMLVRTTKDRLEELQILRLRDKLTDKLTSEVIFAARGVLLGADPRTVLAVALAAYDRGVARETS